MDAIIIKIKNRYTTVISNPSNLPIILRDYNAIILRDYNVKNLDPTQYDIKQDDDGHYYTEMEIQSQ